MSVRYSLSLDCAGSSHTISVDGPDKDLCGSNLTICLSAIKSLLLEGPNASLERAGWTEPNHEPRTISCVLSTNAPTLLRDSEIVTFIEQIDDDNLIEFGYWLLKNVLGIINANIVGELAGGKQEPPASQNPWVVKLLDAGKRKFSDYGLDPHDVRQYLDKMYCETFQSALSHALSRISSSNLQVLVTAAEAPTPKNFYEVASMVESLVDNYIVVAGIFYWYGRFFAEIEERNCNCQTITDFYRWAGVYSIEFEHKQITKHYRFSLLFNPFFYFNLFTQETLPLKGPVVPPFIATCQHRVENKYGMEVVKLFRIQFSSISQTGNIEVSQTPIDGLFRAGRARHVLRLTRRK